MRIFTLWSLVAVLITTISACSKTVYVPVIQKEVVSVHDTTVLHQRDTLVKVPEVRYKDFVGLLDTLVLETGLARSTAFVDTTAGVLKGTLEQRGKLPVQVQWKERVVYRDSVSYRDVPVPVEVVKRERYVPWIVKVLAALGGIAAAGAVFWLLRRFKVI